MNDLEQFFYHHAGYSYDPMKETLAQGHCNTAKELARAYIELMNSDAYVTWEIDPDITSHSWESTREIERNTLIAMLHVNNEIVSSLGGIDVKECNSGDPYCKVIEAELWQEFATQQNTGAWNAYKPFGKDYC